MIGQDVDGRYWLKINENGNKQYFKPDNKMTKKVAIKRARLEDIAIKVRNGEYNGR